MKKEMKSIRLNADCSRRGSTWSRFAVCLHHKLDEVLNFF
jgi:hypothetical protein